jgi:hypothetical protein
MKKPSHGITVELRASRGGICSAFVVIVAIYFVLAIHINVPIFLNFTAMELDEIVCHIFGRDVDTSRICDTDPSSSSPPLSK